VVGVGSCDGKSTVPSASGGQGIASLTGLIFARRITTYAIDAVPADALPCVNNTWYAERPVYHASVYRASVRAPISLHAGPRARAEPAVTVRAVRGTVVIPATRDIVESRGAAQRAAQKRENSEKVAARKVRGTIYEAIRLMREGPHVSRLVGVCIGNTMRTRVGCVQMCLAGLARSRNNTPQMRNVDRTSSRRSILDQRPWSGPSVERPLAVDDPDAARLPSVRLATAATDRAGAAVRSRQIVDGKSE
jgi:hypothetical protein